MSAHQDHAELTSLVYTYLDPGGITFFLFIPIVSLDQYLLTLVGNFIPTDRRGYCLEAAADRQDLLPCSNQVLHQSALHLPMIVKRIPQCRSAQSFHYKICILADNNYIANDK